MKVEVKPHQTTTLTLNHKDAVATKVATYHPADGGLFVEFTADGLCEQRVSLSQHGQRVDCIQWLGRPAGTWFHANEAPRAPGLIGYLFGQTPKAVDFSDLPADVRAMLFHMEDLHGYMNTPEQVPEHVRHIDFEPYAMYHLDCVVRLAREQFVSYLERTC